MSMELSSKSSFKLFLQEIRYEQTLFSLPFIYTGALLGSKFNLTLYQLILITTAAASARALGMMLNRIIDISIDRLNPRTKNRHLASGRISFAKAVFFSFVSLAIYLISAYLLGPLPLKLSWVPVLLFVIYPYTKRFTWLCHVFLGCALGLAPLAGWIAVNSNISSVPLLLFLSVLFWVAGFDIYYASLDYEFDVKNKIQSIPARFGVKTAAYIALLFHALTILFLISAGYIYGAGWLWFLFAAIGSIFLFSNDINYFRLLGTDAINAYLQKNSYFSVIIFVGTLFEMFFKIGG